MPYPFFSLQAESFARVFSSIAATEGADENDIFMFFNDSTVHIYDSPFALGITVADILGEPEDSSIHVGLGIALLLGNSFCNFR